MIKVKVVKDIYSKSNGFKPIDNLVGGVFEVEKISIYEEIIPHNFLGKKFVTINGVTIWEGEFEVIESPVEEPAKNNAADSNSISEIEFMEISDICICGTFMYRGVVYGFCFTPTENQKHWDFYPRLRANQKGVKEALTARIFRDVVVNNQ